MKKKILALVLTVAMCTLMSSTVFAASSSSSSSSSSKSHSSSSKSSGGSSSSSSSSSASKTTSEATKGNVNTDSVTVATQGADGSVQTVSLTQHVQQVNNAVSEVASAAAAGAANGEAGAMTPGDAVSAVMTRPASETFKATINALGGNIKLVNAGGYSVSAAAPDEAGNTIASVGTVPGVTKYAFVMLTSVNIDGTIEIVEGVVDPVSLQVMGVFTGTPATITVSVIVPANS